MHYSENSGTIVYFLLFFICFVFANFLRLLFFENFRGSSHNLIDFFWVVSYICSIGFWALKARLLREV